MPEVGVSEKCSAARVALGSNSSGLVLAICFIITNKHGWSFIHSFSKIEIEYIVSNVVFM